MFSFGAGISLNVIDVVMSLVGKVLGLVAGLI